eukprot:693839-Hanusia_phi.AAC.2
MGWFWGHFVHDLLFRLTYAINSLHVNFDIILEDNSHANIVLLVEIAGEIEFATLTRYVCEGMPGLAVQGLRRWGLYKRFFPFFQPKKLLAGTSNLNKIATLKFAFTELPQSGQDPQFFMQPEWKKSGHS